MSTCPWVNFQNWVLRIQCPCTPPPTHSELECVGPNKLECASRAADMSMSLATATKKKLRFSLGTRVECCIAGAWKQGCVVAHFYIQDSFPAGYCVPYQVQLDDGRLIFENQLIQQILLASVCNTARTRVNSKRIFTISSRTFHYDMSLI